MRPDRRRCALHALEITQQIGTSATLALFFQLLKCCEHRVRFATPAKSLQTIDGSIMAFLAMHDEPDLDALTNWLGASRQVLAPLVQWGEGTMAPAELRAPLPEPDPNPKGKPREPNGDLMAQSPPMWS